MYEVIDEDTLSIMRDREIKRRKNDEDFYSMLARIDNEKGTRDDGFNISHVVMGDYEEMPTGFVDKASSYISVKLKEMFN